MNEDIQWLGYKPLYKIHRTSLIILQKKHEAVQASLSEMLVYDVVQTLNPILL
jgi:hypothetical protein